MQRDTMLMEAAAKREMSVEEMRTKLGMHQLKIDSDERKEQMKNDTKERLFAAEVGVKERHGEGL